jgi:signal peptidase I
MSETPVVAKSASTWRIAWAALLSLFVPGLGHYYAGERKLGIGILGAGVAFDVAVRMTTYLAEPKPGIFLAVAGLAALAVAAGVFIAFDAARRARRQAVPVRASWLTSSLAVFMLAFVVFVSLDYGLPLRWQTFSIPSGSNVPTLMVGDVLVADKRPLKPADLSGKVIVFLSPTEHVHYIKRVVAIARQTVQVKAGHLLIDGNFVPCESVGEYSAADENGITVVLKRYHETLPGRTPHDIIKYYDDDRSISGAAVDVNNTPMYTVPDGTAFVLGDNRDNSRDSRFPSVGFIPLENVVGVAYTIYWARDHARIGTLIK